MSTGINCTPAQIISWFVDSEKCLMHSRTIPLEIIQVNLSNDQLDALIEQGKENMNRKINS